MSEAPAILVPEIRRPSDLYLTVRVEIYGCIWRIPLTWSLQALLFLRE